MEEEILSGSVCLGTRSNADARGRAMETNASCVEDVSPPPSTANGNNNNNNKPGRKFGLIGQRPAAGTGTPPNSPAVTADGRRMSVREDQRQQNWMYSLSEQEMEDKFNAICLSIRTESLTLGQRLEHQLAERDLVEANLNQEMKGLHALFVVSRDSYSLFSRFCDAQVLCRRRSIHWCENLQNYLV